MRESSFVDWCYYYVFPFICSFGLFFSIVSIIIFFKINRSQSTIQIYKYLLVYSLSDAVSLFISIFVGFSRCGNHCNGRDRGYWIKLYELFIYLFLGNIFYSFSALIDLIVAINRYLRLTNRLQETFNFSPYKIMFALFALSVLINLPHIILFQITELSLEPAAAVILIDNSTLNGTADSESIAYDNNMEAPPLQSYYTIELNEWSKKKSSNKVFAIILFVKDTVLLVSLLIINIIMALSLREKMNPNRHSAAISPPPPTKDLAVISISKKAAAERKPNNKISKMIDACCVNKKKPAVDLAKMAQPNENGRRARDEPPNLLIHDVEIKLLTEAQRISSEATKNGHHAKRLHSAVAVDEPTKSYAQRNGENVSFLSVDHLDMPRAAKSNLKCLNGYMERRITIMILCICTIFFMGHFPEMLYSFIFKLKAANDIAGRNYFIIFCNFMAYSTRGMDFFVYYIFNKNFKHTFKTLFCQCFSRNF